MKKRQVKCIKTVKFSQGLDEQFTLDATYMATLSLHNTTVHVHAINNDGDSHGIGQFSLWGLLKDTFFKEHFVFVK